MNQDYLTALRYMGLFSRLKRLSDSTIADGRKLYQSIDIGIEPNWFLVFRIVLEGGQSSISEISARLKFAHPSVISIVKKMKVAGYLKITPSTTDKRRQVITLTEKASEELPEMEKVWQASERAVRSLFQNDVFMEELEKMEKALSEESFYQRVRTRLQTQEVIIRDYHSGDAEQFAKLNFHWLEKYFTVEPYDKKVLSNPEKEILSKGGKILVATIAGEVVGVVALDPKSNTTIELCKMAVLENLQGKGIGKKLMEAAISEVRQMAFELIILYSSTKLKPALKLYEKYGFKEVEVESGADYKRADIKMELNLGKDKK